MLLLLAELDCSLCTLSTDIIIIFVVIIIIIIIIHCSKEQQSQRYISGFTIIIILIAKSHTTHNVHKNKLHMAGMTSLKYSRPRSKKTADDVPL